MHNLFACLCFTKAGDQVSFRLQPALDAPEPNYVEKLPFPPPNEIAPPAPPPADPGPPPELRVVRHQPEGNVRRQLSEYENGQLHLEHAFLVVFLLCLLLLQVGFVASVTLVFSCPMAPIGALDHIEQMVCAVWTCSFFPCYLLHAFACVLGDSCHDHSPSVQS